MCLLIEAAKDSASALSGEEGEKNSHMRIGKRVQLQAGGEGLGKKKKIG